MCVEGASLEEILGYLTDILPRRQIYFGIYDLKYAAKSGRIPTAAAFVGTVLNLKPVMKIFDRSITTAAKCRGERKLVEKVAEMSIAAVSYTHLDVYKRQTGRWECHYVSKGFFSARERM